MIVDKLYKKRLRLSMVFVKIYSITMEHNEIVCKIAQEGSPLQGDPLFYHEALPPFDHPDVAEYGR